MRYLLLPLLLLLLAGATTALAADYVLITNTSNPLTSVAERDVKNFYLGKKTVWDNGDRVTVYTQTTSAVHIAFVKAVVSKTPQQYATYWKKSLFTGTGLPPKDFASDAEVKAAVAAQPGAIGYITPAALDASVKALALH